MKSTKWILDASSTELAIRVLQEKRSVWSTVQELEVFAHFSTGVFPFSNATQRDAVAVRNSPEQTKLNLHSATVPGRWVSHGWKPHHPCLTQLTQFPQPSGAHWIQGAIIQPIQTQICKQTIILHIYAPSSIDQLQLYHVRVT